MMVNRKKGFSLVEIILSVIVLSVVSVISLKLFLLSNSLNEKAYELDQSVFLAESKLQEIRHGGIDKAVYFYSKEWEVVDAQGEAEYALRVFSEKQEDLLRYRVSVVQLNLEKEKVIYELESKTFK